MKMKYELKECGNRVKVYRDGIWLSEVNTNSALYPVVKHLETMLIEKNDKIRHLESEIKAKDERIAELESQLDTQYPFTKEPFIFTKDTPVRIEGGEVELFFHDCDTVYGKRKDLSQNEWEFHQWNKYGHSKSLVSRYNLIPILPEKRVVDVWIGIDVNAKNKEYHLFSKSFDVALWKDGHRNRISEHHTIELKGK